MSVKTTIGDGKGTGREAHLHQRNGDIGVVAYTKDLEVGDVLFFPVVNPELGIEMAIDGSFGGTPVKVHDGTDSGLWTGSSVNGTKFTFDSTDRAKNGTKSVEVDNASINDIMQFATGVDVALTGYIGLSMFINVDKNWSDEDSWEVYGYNTGTNLTVGDSVALENYLSFSEFDVWHKLSIPLTDMNISNESIHAIRFEQVAKSGPGATFYVDDINIEETSGSKTFSVEAPKDKKYIIFEFRFSYVDAFDSTLLNSSMPNISYDKILGVSQLVNGIVFQRISDGEILFAASIKSIGDSIKGGSNLINPIGDGVNTCVTLQTIFQEPVVLDSREDDSISVTINDDLTGLISFTAIALGKIVSISE